jgi:hypothetical protein
MYRFIEVGIELAYATARVAYSYLFAVVKIDVTKLVNS